MHGLQTPIVGREPELAAIQRFVGDVATGPASVVLEGLAGIGKTAIWTQSVVDAQAAGVRVRTCRCGEPDVAWAFSGL